jgi:hypothetical protein
MFIPASVGFKHSFLNVDTIDSTVRFGDVFRLLMSILLYVRHNHWFFFFFT